MNIEVIGENRYYLDSKDEQLTVEPSEDGLLWRVKQASPSEIQPFREWKYFEDLHYVEQSYRKLEGIALLHSSRKDPC